MRIATVNQPAKNRANEWTFALALRELTIEFLSVSNGVDWECGYILDALALGNLDLAARGLEKYLGRVGNQFPLRSRSLILEIARASRAADFARAVACCESLKQYQVSFGFRAA